MTMNEETPAKYHSQRVLMLLTVYRDRFVDALELPRQTFLCREEPNVSMFPYLQQ